MSAFTTRGAGRGSVLIAIVYSVTENMRASAILTVTGMSSGIFLLFCLNLGCRSTIFPDDFTGHFLER